MSRSPNYCFTINNYTEETLHKLDELVCKYLVYGLEVGAECGTPHVQGYVKFKNAMTITAFNKKIGGKLGGYWANCGKRKGTPKEASGYCKKGIWNTHTDWSVFHDKPHETWVGKARGTISAQGERKDLVELTREVEEGTVTPEDICLSNPNMYHQYGRTLNKAYEICLRRRFRTWMTTCEWIYGPTGVGKSHKAFEGYSHETHYVWNLNESFQCNYTGQETVIINDFRGEIKYNTLLQMIDKYPHHVPVKGAPPFPFLAKHIIITSSLPPDRVYNRRDEEDSLEQLLRRITVSEITKKWSG